MLNFENRPMKKLPLIAIPFLLAACGDEVSEVTNVYQSGLEVVDSAKDLPKCNDENEGQQAWVKGETSVRICSDGEWFALSSGEVSNGDLSCKTEELKDKSGLKIVCNGDSIGVVYNGAQGEAGKDGEDGKDAEIPNDILANDSERVAISLDSLVGYTQKGPFLKGSTVYLYELSDGRTLKQTNGNFTSIITRDDGRYKFSARDLASQYAMIVVDGNYRNEVTGKSSNSPIRLRALTDMRKRSSANVNLLTHMEFDRVYYLVTREGKTVKQAKKQAQAEIFNAFHIDTTALSGSSEDLDVFGSGEANAALLAISVLLQRDLDPTQLLIELTEIADDMETDGLWNGHKSDSIKAAIAQWALAPADMEIPGGNPWGLDTIESYVKGWGLSDSVPDFKKHVRKFYGIELGIGVCGSESVPKGTVKQVANPESALSKPDNRTRFICADPKTGRWIQATELEVDRFGWKDAKTEDGTLWTGPFTGKKLVWDADTLRYASEQEIAWNKGCVSYYDDPSIVLDGQKSYYKCTAERRWVFDIEKNSGTVYDAYRTPYRTITIENQTWMAENLRYEYKSGNICNEHDCEKYGRYYTWAAAMDSLGLFSQSGKGCGYGKKCSPEYPVRGVCPAGYHLPTIDEWDTLASAIQRRNAASDEKLPQSLQAKGVHAWPNATDAYGFSAVPAGNVTNSSDEPYRYEKAFYWTSTQKDGNDIWVMEMSNTNFDHNYIPKDQSNSISIRCVKN